MVMPTKISAGCRRYLDQRVSSVTAIGCAFSDSHQIFRYYVLRDDMLTFYISDLKARLLKNEHVGWEVSTTGLIE